MAGRDSSCNSEPKYFSGSLIIAEPPLQVLPSLAIRIGLEEAIFLQQLYFYLNNPHNGRLIKGKRWIYKTLNDWFKIFPFWSERTIRRLIGNLEGMHIIESCQPEGGLSRRKYYRINEGMLNRLITGRLEEPENHMAKLATSSGQVGHIMRPNWPLPHAEKTCREEEQRREQSETAPAAIGFEGDDFVGYPEQSEPQRQEYPAMCKPDRRTKEQKLAVIQPPKDYPSEWEFDAYLDGEELFHVVSSRPDLYMELCRNKWHTWNERLGKWVQIRYWKKFVAALHEKIAETCPPS